MNARTTVIVLAKTVERETVNTTPNVICCRMQVAEFGWPMESRGQRKQKMSEMSKMYVRVLLLALTMGVLWCFTMIPRTTVVNAEKHKEIEESAIPKGSS